MAQREVFHCWGAGKLERLETIEFWSIATSLHSFNVDFVRLAIAVPDNHGQKSDCEKVVLTRLGRRGFRYGDKR